MSSLISLFSAHHWRNLVSLYQPSQANSPVDAGSWVSRSRMARSASATSRSVR